MADFNPYEQNVTFLLRDGKTQVNTTIDYVDYRRIEAVCISLNYGAQIGACIIMLFVVLAMTPTAKLRRPSSILHILGLIICCIRTGLLAAFFTSKFMEFYVFYADDYVDVPFSDYQVSVTANVFSMLLVVVVEAALMNQAWTMVVLWPKFAKYTVTVLSAIITLMTISSRIAFTVVQSQAIWHLEPIHMSHSTLIHAAIILNAFSICWFCALFNVKLIAHLVQHRGILVSKGSLTPMEVLIMTNGILMIFPVIFTGLEWGHFQNFEAASLTLTSVALILPLGTVAA
ncbi:mating type pheromone G-protein coupled receptor, partial [Sarocladium strictum]